MNKNGEVRLDLVGKEFVEEDKFGVMDTKIKHNNGITKENAASDSNISFLDSGCSNQTTGVKSLFNEIDETFKQKVTLGDNKQIKVEGKGNVAIKSISGNVKLLYDVYYIRSLLQNLLSVGQLMATGYSIMFNDVLCDQR
ncbi:hypothetical protein V6N12_000321 [Hibiscus sabdariffa]|uniref:Retrovirus-related Pol polyprotein from transposon TNT 1-94-like beta-barrel domain-containing protein n=1 Tax=Hibiscus sabdariffa TaxID=183260 RepID=A0ABR2ANV1_9ROSI